MRGRLGKTGIAFLAIALSLAVVGAGFAYFSDVETSVGNVGQAGTLDMAISEDGSTWHNGAPVNAAWTSPEGWAPGENWTTDVIYLKNVGSIAADRIYMRFHDCVCGQGNYADAEGSPSPYNLWDYIQLVSVNEYSPNNGWCLTTFDTGTANIWLNYWSASADGSISLHDLCTVANSGGTSKKTGLYTYTESGNPYLPVGGVARIQMTFKLMENTNNDYQGDKCTFSVDFIASNAGTPDIDQAITEY